MGRLSIGAIVCKGNKFIVSLCLVLAIGGSTQAQNGPGNEPVAPLRPEMEAPELEAPETLPPVVPPEGPPPNEYGSPIPGQSLFDRFREGPAPIPPEGPQPNQYGEPMLLAPLLGGAKKYPSVQVGGVFQVNSVFFSQTATNRDTVGNEPDGSGIRRARLTAFGSVSENIDYRFQFDLGDFGRPTVTDMYMDVKDVPLLGKVRIGNWKQPFSLEEITSFRFNPFLNRSSIFLFHPFRRTGVGFYDWSEDGKWTWAASAFRGFNDFYGNDLTDIQGYGGVGRLTHCFYYENDGAEVLHFGASYSVIAPSNQNLVFGTFGGFAPELGLIQGQYTGPTTNTSPGFRQNQSMVSTGKALTRTYYDEKTLKNVAGPYGGTINYQDFHIESAWVRGPLSIQAEGDLVPVTLANGTTPLFAGGYIFATYFLTGEHRTYDRNLAIFDRIQPKTNSRTGHLFGGAWELAARLNYISLNNINKNGVAVYGGTLIDPTFGVNWYLNPYTKFTMNYIPAYLNRALAGPNQSLDGNQVRSQASAWGLQAQVDF
jgi:phosphate-selective porin OprO/OprP